MNVPILVRVYSMLVCAAALVCMPLHALTAEVAIAPHNDMVLTLKAIQQAKKDLYINIYEMQSKTVGDAIVDRVNDGLHVEILEEGSPVGGVSSAEKAIRSQIVEAMNSASCDDHYYLMQKPDDGSKRRYRWDHAKYVIVDGKKVLIGSENFSESAKPTDEKLGNRGWETLLEDAALANRFKSIYDTDTDTSFGDIVDQVDSRDSHGKSLLTLFAAMLPTPSQQQKPNQGDLPDNTTVDVDSVTTLFSPNSLDALTSMIQGAKKSIQLELMTFSPLWGRTGDDSPLLTAIEDAADRGVSVQVLLNDENVFKQKQQQAPIEATASDNNNHTTVDEINQYASDNKDDLEARIADISAMGVDYIHNKGALIDGKQVLISSINWDQNSVVNNREAGVLLNSAEAYQFFEPTFQQDWRESGDRR